MRGKGKDKMKDCLRLWKFKQNPFDRPIALTQHEGMSIADWAGPRTVLNKLEDIVRHESVSYKAYTILLNGEYGSGKTHSLRTLQKHLIDGMHGYPVYIVSHRGEKKRGLSFVVKAVGFEDLMESISKLDFQTSANKIDGLREFLLENGYDNDFATALDNLHKGKDITLTWLWLSGNATKKQISSLGFDTFSEDKSDSKSILIQILRLLANVYKKVLVIFDDFEVVLGSRDSEKVKDYWELISDISRENLSGSIGFIFSVATPVLQKTEEIPAAVFMNRVSYEVRIPHFSFKDSENFIRDLFDYSRSGEVEKWCSPPFKNLRTIYTFIDFVHRKEVNYKQYERGVTPRHILRMGTKLLQSICFEESTSINSHDVRKIFEEED